MRAGVLAIVACLCLCACGSSTTSPTTTSPTTTSYVSISASAPFKFAGQRVQLVATAGRGDFQSVDVTNRAAWDSSNPGIVSVSSTGLATALTNGTTTIRAVYDGVTGTLPITITGGIDTDCNSYSTAGLQIQAGPEGFSLFDGFQFLALLDTQADADRALALARRYDTQCFIGRNNNRANRRAYIVDYWKGTGVATSLGAEDCDGYSPSNLQMLDLGGLGWAVMDGARQLLLLDNQSDANAALVLARQYTARCFIGRGNNRPTPLSYIVDYWK